MHSHTARVALLRRTEVSRLIAQWIFWALLMYCANKIWLTSDVSIRFIASILHNSLKPLRIYGFYILEYKTMQRRDRLLQLALENNENGHTNSCQNRAVVISFSTRTTSDTEPSQ